MFLYRFRPPWKSLMLHLPPKSSVEHSLDAAPPNQSRPSSKTMSLKREPLSPSAANRKKSRSEADDVFGDLSQQKVSAAPPSPFTPLESVYKDGDGSLLFDLKNHVHYSQHYVEPSKYIDLEWRSMRMQCGSKNLPRDSPRALLPTASVLLSR